jgi:hypothetical protein
LALSGFVRRKGMLSFGKGSTEIIGVYGGDYIRSRSLEAKINEDRRAKRKATYVTQLILRNYSGGSTSLGP